MNVNVFSSAFRRWVDRAANTITFDSGESAVVIADGGGEIRFYVRGGGSDSFALTRAERSEAERFVMSSDDVTDIERALAVELAGNVRQREGLARLQVPGRVGEYAAGISAREEDGLVRLLVGQRGPIRFVKRDPYRLQPDVQFSYFANASVTEIIESAGSISGGPLFSTQ
ncbi:Imm61 family immunity protein [Cryobacterium sp. PH31-O1]|uniref:Imm61 family immunity protein n=1 Tax=Cryobacterium sp. PH31-O1 TaxID=3046306 RepID=UPI0024BA4ECB|nr:Imm61 family immunity protein [Cryobacterium sp. PH31-O1]MDJ0338529.1 Imm61 family immunity protein [Cryobacterium sp. PH31-O1]